MRMEKRELTCICCPKGCALTVELEEGKITKISGNTCRQGEEYARKEVLAPTRIVTSTVRVEGGTVPMVSVKTREDIPKDKIFACMESLKGLTIHAPVSIGDVVLKDAAGTGVDIVATRDVERQIQGEKVQ
jgi:CxxC motif-containing protein